MSGRKKTDSDYWLATGETERDRETESGNKFMAKVTLTIVVVVVVGFWLILRGCKP